MEQQISTNLGEIIRIGRIRKGLRQKQLAEIMGVQSSLISKWENNYQIPSGDDLIKLAAILDIVSDLFPGYEKVRQNPASETSQIELKKEIDNLWQVIRQKDQEDADFKRIIRLLLEEKINQLQSK